MTQILSERIEFATPWFELVSKQVSGEAGPYYALRMPDYVTVVAFTAQEEIVLVRQYRPAVERNTLELPAARVEKDETPEQSARRELAEECGFEAGEMELLGTLISDTGRNENRLWCYLAKELKAVGPGYVPEPGVETVLVKREKLGELLSNGEFDHALHLAALMLAISRHGPQLLALK